MTLKVLVFDMFYVITLFEDICLKFLYTYSSAIAI